MSVGSEEAGRRFGAWFDDHVPADYAADPGRYRHRSDFRRRYQAAAFDAGWLVPSWPRELGGQGMSLDEEVAVRLEAARRRAPKLENVQTVGVVAPALRQFGTPAQVQQHLVLALRGEEDWALGMSEPDAGSDLAALRTRARRGGDDFVVDGQKIWTTQAHTSPWLMLYCRTDAEAPRHRGISCLLVPSDLPGITIREIPIGWTGADEFCEVFLDGVRVPAENLLGELHGGWKVAISALAHERAMIWINNFADLEHILERCARTLVQRGRAGDAEALGRLATETAGLRAVGMDAVRAQLADRPNPEAMMLKLMGSETLQRACELALTVAGECGLFDDTALFEDFEALGATIYGGTSEVQRNIVAERVLGLPRAG
jgi:alkylation response protein AidB-like acyl-CoA dehydrogenase